MPVVGLARARGARRADALGRARRRLEGRARLRRVAGEAGRPRRLRAALGRSRRPRALRSAASRRSSARPARTRRASRARSRSPSAARTCRRFDGWRRAGRAALRRRDRDDVGEPGARAGPRRPRLEGRSAAPARVARRRRVHLRRTVGPQSGGLGYGPADPGRSLRVPRRAASSARASWRTSTTSRTAASSRRRRATRRSRLRFPDVRFGHTLHGHHAHLRRGRARPEGRPRHHHVPRRATPTLGQRRPPRRRRVEALRARHERARRPDAASSSPRSRRPAASGASTASRRTRGEAPVACDSPSASAGATTSSAPRSAASTSCGSSRRRASLGFPRDEGVYFRAGSDYVALVAPALRARRATRCSRARSTRRSAINHEHPALMKTLFGASWWLFHEKWHVFADASTAFRLPGMARAGVAALGRRTSSARAPSAGARALVAAVLLALMPRVFFHAHLACFDVPITAMWILCIYVHWRAQETRSSWAGSSPRASSSASRSRRSTTRGFLPVVARPARALRAAPRDLARAAASGASRSRRASCRWPSLGPVVFSRSGRTSGTTRWRACSGGSISTCTTSTTTSNFSGKTTSARRRRRATCPSWWSATVPTITLLLFFIGAFDRARDRACGRLRRVGCGGVVHRPLGPDRRRAIRARPTCSSPSSFGVRDRRRSSSRRRPSSAATKHWLPAYPVLALFAGRGLRPRRRARCAAPCRALDARAVARGAGRRSSRASSLAPLAVTAHSHPFGLSSYVPLVGGTAGGADLGLNRQFWGFTTQTAAEEYLNAEGAARRDASSSTTRRGTRGAGCRRRGACGATCARVGARTRRMFALVQHELHMNEVDYSIWVADGTDAPGVHRRARRRAHRQHLPETVGTYGARQKRSTSKSTTVTPFFVGPTTGSRPFDSTARPPLRRMTSSAYAAWIGRSQGKT